MGYYHIATILTKEKPLWNNFFLQFTSKGCFLKGQSQEIFDLWFFHQTVALGPLIHGLKRFCI
jgi:hypothetical protein